MTSFKWAALAAVNALLSGLLGVGLPWSVNLASSLLGGGGAVVPTDGFTQTLLASVVFLAMLVVELTLHFGQLVGKLDANLSRVVREAVRAETRAAINESFATSMTRALTDHADSAPAVGEFLSEYFSALERIPASRRALVAKITQLRSEGLVKEVETSLAGGYEVSPEEGFRITEYLLRSASSYVSIDRAIYDLERYWTPAWHEFANRMRERTSIKKTWIALLPRRRVEDRWDVLKKIWEYVRRHDFEFRFSEIAQVEDVLGMKSVDFPSFESAEVLDNQFALLWDTSGEGYQGGKLLHVRALDLAADSNAAKFFQTVASQSSLIDGRKSGQLTRDWNKAHPESA